MQSRDRGRDRPGIRGPTRGTINIVTGVAFLDFALWTRRGDELTQDGADKARTSQGAAILAVGVA